MPGKGFCLGTFGMLGSSTCLHLARRNISPPRRVPSKSSRSRRKVSQGFFLKGLPACPTPVVAGGENRRWGVLRPEERGGGTGGRNCGLRITIPVLCSTIIGVTR